MTAAGGLDLPPGERERFKAYLRPLAGQVVEIAVRKLRKPVTRKARGYYRGVVLPEFAEFIGDDEDELHGDLCRKFLGVDDPEAPLPKARRTRDLDEAEFARFVDDVIRLAGQMGCAISPPDPHYRWNRTQPRCT